MTAAGVVNKLCFVLSASTSRPALHALVRPPSASYFTSKANPSRSIFRRPLVALSYQSTNCSITMSAVGGAHEGWPNPEAFNALPGSIRAKLYSDFADAGKMTWVSHEGPLKHPLPPFTAETALQKTKAAEAAWNTRDPAAVAKAYSPDTVWRNRNEIFIGRKAVQEFLTRKWIDEKGYRLKKHLWAFEGNRISARFEYEWYDDNGQWYRTHGNEHWEFDERGYMRWRDMSANDLPIEEHESRLG